MHPLERERVEARSAEPEGSGGGPSNPGHGQPDDRSSRASSAERSDRERWNERHSGAKASEIEPPSELLTQWLPRIAPGRALDIACGRGRNALYLAAHGFRVDAVDLSDTALEIAAERARRKQLQVRWIQRDLSDGFIPDRPYALIVMIRYVDTALLRRLSRHLLPEGWLLCEEHLVWDGDVDGPRDPRYRVHPGELARALGELECRFLEEGLVEQPGARPIALARAVFQAPPRGRRLTTERFDRR